MYPKKFQKKIKKIIGSGSTWSETDQLNLLATQIDKQQILLQQQTERYFFCFFFSRFLCICEIYNLESNFSLSKLLRLLFDVGKKSNASNENSVNSKWKSSFFNFKTLSNQIIGNFVAYFFTNL